MVEGGGGLLGDDSLGLGSVATDVEVELDGVPALRGRGSRRGRGRGRRVVLKLKGFEHSADVVDN